MGKPEKRKKEVLELLELHKQLGVAQVAEAMSVSEATVRRLFVRLEEDHVAIRTHGGIRLVPQMQRKYDMTESQVVRVPEKAAIGAEVAGLIDTGDMIFLDSGSTVAKLAEAIKVRIASQQLDNLTVLTNSLNVVDILSGVTKVLLVGGEVRNQRRDVCGPVAEKNLAMFKVRHAFFGTDGIDLECGFMTTDERTATMNQEVLQRAGSKVVVADHTKFQRASFISYATFQEMDAVYTDDGLDKKDARSFEDAGATIHRVVVTVPSDKESIPPEKLPI